MIENVSATLPFSRQQVFDLAADIESYPRFLHGWMAGDCGIEQCAAYPGNIRG